MSVISGDNPELAVLWEHTLRVVKLLTDKRYDDIVSVTRGVRLSSDQLRNTVLEHGMELEPPPSARAARFEPIRIVDSEPPEWSVSCDLWSRGSPSDLTLELTIRRTSQDSFVIEIDGLHVL